MSVYVHKRNKMAESKVILLILNFVLPPLYVYAWIINLDNTKSTILFIMAVFFASVRFYFWVIKEKQMRRKREMELEHQQRELSKEV